MAKADGGPAFPELQQYRPSGMSLRDHFAGLTLCSVPLRNWDIEKRGDEDVIKQWAETAYRVADAMLAARASSRSKDPG